MSVTLPISVVIPAFNREATLHRCLDSILGQDVTPKEIIVVDDCSKDQTIDVAKSFGEMVRVIVQPINSGAQAARNRGVLEASEPWIAFQDSDDEWLPGKLSRQWEVLSSLGGQQDLILHSDCLRCTDGSDSPWVLPATEGNEARRRLLSRPAPMFQGMLVAKSSLEKIGLLDEKVPSYQEWETSIRLSAYGRFVHIREPLFRYNFHAGPTISKDAAREAAGYSYVTAKHEQAIRSEVGEGTWRNHMIVLARLGLLGNRLDLARMAANDLGGIAHFLVSMCLAGNGIHPKLRTKLVRSLAILKFKERNPT
jgi:glycosyltransferase involved in cell wall biosynthesis